MMLLIATAAVAIGRESEPKSTPQSGPLAPHGYEYEGYPGAGPNSIGPGGYPNYGPHMGGGGYPGAGAGGGHMPPQCRMACRRDCPGGLLAPCRPVCARQCCTITPMAMPGPGPMAMPGGGMGMGGMPY